MNSVVKRIVMFAAAVFFLVYVGFHVYNGFAKDITTITVERTTAYQTVDTTGLVFRDETVIDTTATGYFFYTVADGNRVAKHGTIADVYPTMEDALGQQELNALNEEIDTLVSINAQGTTNRANLSSINQQINDTWLSLSQAAGIGSFGQMKEYRSKLQALLNKKYLTMGKESSFDVRIAELKAKRETLSTSFAKATDTVSSPVAGYFISNVDGFEDVVTTEQIETLSVDRLQELLNTEATPKEGKIGKVVGDYEWYLACVVPLADTTFIKKGLTVTVYLPFVTEETIPATVAAVNKGKGDTAAVVLRCTHMSGDLSAIRKEQVELRITAYDGLYIPDSAVHFDDEQNAGVFIQKGNVLSFRRIQVLYHDEDDRFSISKMVEDTAYVQLYDKIVTGGDDLYDGKLVR